MKRGAFLKSAVGLFATPMLFNLPDRHIWTPPKFTDCNLDNMADETWTIQPKLKPQDWTWDRVEVLTPSMVSVVYDKFYTRTQIFKDGTQRHKQWVGDEPKEWTYS